MTSSVCSGAHFMHGKKILSPGDTHSRMRGRHEHQTELTTLEGEVKTLLRTTGRTV